MSTLGVSIAVSSFLSGLLAITLLIHLSFPSDSFVLVK